MNQAEAEALMRAINNAQGVKVGAQVAIPQHDSDEPADKWWGVGIYMLTQKDLDEGQMTIGMGVNRVPHAVFYNPERANTGLHISALIEPGDIDEH